MAKNALTESLKLYKHFKKVSIAEFFEKNRHLLGFDNPRKALLIAVKELVDNALDACEEAKILPEIKVTISEVKTGQYKVVVEDNGPGIPPEKVPEVYSSFLFGSKFHRYVSTRGKQGIGAPAIVLYAQLTTGKSIKVISKVSKEEAYFYELKIDIKNNTPLILKKEKINWNKDHGTKVEIILEGSYHKGKQSVDEYIQLTALANPHATIIYRNPRGERFIYKRITKEIPTLYEVKPHPHGIEIGVLEKLLKGTKYRVLLNFLTKTFSSVGEQTAREILKKAGLRPNKKPQTLTFEEIEALYKAMQETKIKTVSAKYIVTLGEDLIRRGLAHIFEPEFIVAKKRRPAVYRGMPFIIEVGIAYGGKINEPKILRLANRVPLQYKIGECAITEAIKSINWKQYGLNAKEGEIPKDPVVILVHMASVWIPFTSESKEAIAPYPEIVKEMKLALKEAARELGLYIKKKQTLTQIGNKYLYLFGYGKELAKYLSKIINKREEEIEKKIEERVKEELYKDLIEIIRTIKDLQALIEAGRINDAKGMLRNMLDQVIKAKVLKESELNTIIENVLRNYKKD